MNIYFTHFLANKFQYIKAVCLHLGVVDTPFMRFLYESHFWGMLFKLAAPLWHYLSKSCIEGSQTYLYLSYLQYEKLSNGSYSDDSLVNRILSKAQNPFIMRCYYWLEFHITWINCWQSLNPLSNKPMY